MELYQDDNEYGRLKNLESFSIMDTAPELSFDQLATIASSVCKTPIALISFIDTDRQWFKSSIGIDLHDVPRHITPCNQTILQDSYFEINDCSELKCEFDEYMLKNGFRYYAGVPIKSHEGYNIGTLCVIDTKPRSLTPDQVKTLKLLSNQVMDLVEVRRAYKLNLERLKEVHDASFKTDHQVLDIAHKSRSKALAELAAGLSFRMRPHILSILTATENLDGQNTHLVHDAATHLSTILNSLEKFVETEKEKSMKPLDIADACRRVLSQIEWKLKRHKVKLDFETEENLVCIGNESQLKEAMYEIINNAIEATEFVKMKSITVRIKEENHQIMIDVSDSGRGVTDTIRPFIFQPFFTTKGAMGLGIGLSLSLGILQRHGGDVQIIHNYNPTTFRISIPKP